jgi:hypothetical protein
LNVRDWSRRTIAMNTPHVIRLREPWEREVVAPSPSDGGGPRTIRCRRRFNWLARLEAGERVWLACDVLDARATFTLNGRRLATCDAPGSGRRLDITDAIAPNNTLEIDLVLADDAIDAAMSSAQLPGEVRLEIGRE